MDRQLKYTWLFGFFVRSLGAARFARAGAPALSAVAVCVAGLAGSGVPLPGDAGSGMAAASVVGPHGAPAALSGAPGGAAPVLSAEPVVVTAPPVLNREQQNLARFIAKTYQLAVDQTQWFVVHAYRAARDLKLDPMLILAVISVESSFDPLAQSHRGAQGLMQVLTRVHADKFLPFGGVTAAFDPLANIRVGAQILNDYLKRDGSVEAALKSYVGAALMPHDGGYGAKVIFERERMAAAAAGKPVPTAPLAQWVAPQAQEGDPVRVRTSAAGTSDAAPESRPQAEPAILTAPVAPAGETSTTVEGSASAPAPRGANDA